ncbi:DOMON-like domain-containing protein [Novosphingobium guangzhouense]|uniref:DOMON-like domain-containing protein n=1 Tax=Novosphingobium guangzhouense TaxID=1850347 RepID=A0A2K2G1K3_9SPHN|nr:DOMON-like domain-containing protein [Novosphingobium guangzhouense]PNU04882.1 hypothetical protein A8V01_18375 [Novosphingobium guangzhouense]
MTQLHFHPAHPPLAIRSVEARIIGHDSQWLRARWKIMGAGRLVVPPFAGRGRAEGLWQTTCFELFLQPVKAAAYTEINLSPSERWNVYDFVGRREGMAERAMPREPDCTLRLGTDMAIFDAAIPVAGLPAAPWRCGFTAVIEEQGGCKSYWSLVHGSDVPDFHDPACFVATIAAPTAP